MANISSQFKKASELYQRALQQYQAKEKEQLAIINQFKVGDVTIKSKLKPQLIALHKEMQHYQDLVDRAENAFERALVSEPIDLGEDIKEVTTNDWHFKKILQMWDKTNSFGKQKIGTVLCRNPRASRNDIIAAMRDSDYKEITHFTDKLHIESVVVEDADTSNIIKDLDKVRHDLIKKVDVLITKKKKLYANVDITTPMSADEKQLDKDIQSIFSQIQSIIQQKRKIKTENVVVEDTGTEADESGMAKGQTKTAIEAATSIQQILDSKGDNFDVPAWVQSYLALASDYLQSINEYYKGNNEN